MGLTATKQLAEAARSDGVGLGAFNVVLLEHAEAIIGAAEDVGVPVILQLSQNTVRYHGSLRPLGRALVAIAQAATVPTAVHLDHATEESLVAEAIDIGFTSVMFDGAALPFDDNVRTTARVAGGCRDLGITIEAELGEIGGKDGAHALGVRTDPAEARRFVDATGVDLLAVAVGTSHAMREQTARVDTDLVDRLRTAVDVPLVLHGSSGVPDAALPGLVAAGITKINIATTLNAAMTDAIRDALDGAPDVVDPRRYIEPARAAIQRRTADLLERLSTVPARPDPTTSARTEEAHA